MNQNKNSGNRKDVFKTCPTCFQPIYLSSKHPKPVKNDQGEDCYRTQECKDIHERQILRKSKQKALTTRGKIQDPKFNPMTDDELETLLSTPSWPRPLNYVSENHLFYSFMQILSCLEQTKQAVLQKGWELFYQKRVEKLGEKYPEAKQDFRRFFVAFNEYMHALWHPIVTDPRVGQDQLPVQLRSLSKAEIKSEDLETVVLEFSRHLLFLRPYSGQPKLQITDEAQELPIHEDYELSYLNWAYIDLRESEIAEKVFKITFSKKGRDYKTIEATLRYIDSEDHKPRAVFKTIADLAASRVKELQEKEYWLTHRQKEGKVQLIHPYDEIDFDKDYHDLTLYYKPFSLASNPCPIRVAVIFDLELSNEYSIGEPKGLKDNLILIFSTDLTGKLKKLQFEFKEQLKRCFSANFDLNASPRIFGGEPGVNDFKRILRFERTIDWEASITSLVSQQRYGPGDLIARVEVVESPQVLIKKTNRPLGAQNDAKKLFGSKPGDYEHKKQENYNPKELEPVGTLIQPEILIQDADYALTQNLIQGDLGDDGDQKSCNMLILRVDEDLAEQVFVENSSFSSCRTELFCGEFKLKAMIHGAESKFYHPTVLQEVNPEDKEQEVLGEKLLKRISRNLKKTKENSGKRLFEDQEGNPFTDGLKDLKLGSKKSSGFFGQDGAESEGGDSQMEASSWFGNKRKKGKSNGLFDNLEKEKQEVDKRMKESPFFGWETADRGLFSGEKRGETREEEMGENSDTSSLQLENFFGSEITISMDFTNIGYPTTISAFSGTGFILQRLLEVKIMVARNSSSISSNFTFSKILTNFSITLRLKSLSL